MPTIIFVLTMLASIVSGQLQNLPKCGMDCLTSAVLNSTCAPTDTPCICADKALQVQAHQCVLSFCTVREQLATLNITNAECGIFSGHDHSWFPPLMFFVIFAGIIFVLRLVSRVVCHTKFWWDDFVNLLAMLGCVAYSTASIVTGNLGLGTEIWAVPQENITTLLKLSYVEFLLYNWCEVTLRTSVLLFYIRVFTVGTGPRRIFLITLIVSNTLSVGFALFNIFQCTPISYFWLRWDEEHKGHCIPANKVTLSGGIIDLFWTVLIIVIPLPYILRLKLAAYKKFAATTMFALGISTIVIMCYRFKTLKAYDVGENPTMDGIGVTLWSAIELDVALICACLPSIYPLFVRLIHRGQPPPEKPAPSSSLITIGGTGGKALGRSKRKRGLWSYPGMTGLTNTHDDDRSTKEPNREYIELEEAQTH
ncbi:hypothetical protein SS1G_02361 [Sclerotinia sclerotiorum 1980 UF-70]|uniref:CFEM domain-containing protein n=2 Tax=Sclerotinia sclerotiorum (strain ATCC 18683 / 1980 / Ss-1) TaxID=665079 RepID=A7EAM9_SCLS1|nr:hypothetical protein SS1G_02361 [Sclerotinia sclerotiorum 1980 UF-70]APA08632.1 hypothetical protein sscle_04g034020 [Sclerotinia sclerotiorum 1980 UF-70]EDN99507.1 hypothetical protein SS1G_02361 [Sclerotinia sclerotiorum 1980 UF-70]